MKEFAAFSLGQLVTHKVLGYRGVIFDVDPLYQGSDEWYEEMAVSRPPKDQPWYHVLVDGDTRSTYVAEASLREDVRVEEIRHPALDTFFNGFKNGSYETNQVVN